LHQLAKSVLGFIRKHELLHPGDRVGVAVSGGADSVALLRLMLELQDELGIVLSVVHLNHQLRGAESNEDESFVCKLAAAHDLEFVCESHDVHDHAQHKKLSLETAAREVRYDFFRRVLDSQLNRVVTAHTLEDQAETLLLKLARGAGTRGLAGIYPKLAISNRPSVIMNNEQERPRHDGVSIVRPLLGTERSQLRKYLAEIGQGWREDATNQDLRHMRNRIRHQVLPVLAKVVNPSLCNVLSETAEIARAEEEYWAAEVLRVLPQIWRWHERGGTINSSALYHLPLALQRRVLRAAAESLRLSLEFRHVDEILDLGSEGNCAALPEAWLAELRGGVIEFSRSSMEIAGYEYELPVPGKVNIPEIGIEIEALLCSGEQKNQKYAPEHLVPATFVQRRLVIRNWRAGERFWPAHTREPKKIKELLQDKHVTGERKRLWPVVASGEEIIWLRGFGVRRDFQASGGSGILIREVGTKPDLKGPKAKLQ
jgi:tRNA(Ile)-lysidine synthase